MGARLKVVAASVTLVGTAWLGGTAQPVGAAGPSGGTGTCAADGGATTLEGLLALAEANGIPAANAEALFGRLNKNEDDWICVQVRPNQSGFNFIDNQAVGLDR